MRNNVVYVLLALVFLVVFNVLFFIIGGTTHTASVWISYAFVHAAYCSILLVPVLTVRERGTAVLTGALYLVALIYFGVELIAGTVFIILGLKSFTIPLIVQLALFAIFLYRFLLTLLANDQTYKSMRKQKREAIYIQMMAQKVRAFFPEYKESESRRMIDRVFNSLNESSLESFPGMESVEQRLQEQVNDFCEALEDKKVEQIEALGKKVLRTVQERNTTIALMR